MEHIGYRRLSLLILLFCVIISGTIIGIVAGADQVLIGKKTVHLTDDTFVNELNDIRFSISNDQYNSYKFIKVDYQNSNPATSLWLYITSDDLYELNKRGHGITYQGLGSQLFGDGTIYCELNDFKGFTGFNNLRIYGMVRPFSSKSDVTFSVSLTNNNGNSNPTPTFTQSQLPTTIVETIPQTTPSLETTPIITKSPTLKATIKQFTPWPTDTPTQQSPIGIVIIIFALGFVAFTLHIRK